MGVLPYLLAVKKVKKHKITEFLWNVVLCPISPADVAPGGGSFNVFETLQLSRIIASVSTISLEKLHLLVLH
jgi:hypothetical protein